METWSQEIGSDERVLHDPRERREKIIIRGIQTGYSLVLKWRNGTLKLNVLKGLFYGEN